jgi:hypothetical protein
MESRISPVVFALVYCIVYAVVLAFDWPLFNYYPQVGEFTWGWTPKLEGAGPAMTWYGLMATAGAVALLAALILRDKVVAAALRNWLWLFPLGAMLACVYFMRIFFRQLFI